MINIDKLSRTPIYEQLIEQIRELIIKGDLKADDLLPSIRVLSQQVSVNPNTLQKAYTELERQGICYSVPGNGRYISQNARDIVKADKKELIKEIEAISADLAQIGVDINEIFESVKKSYNNKRRND